MALVVSLALCAPACSDVTDARPQWEVVVASDAQVPQFFDRVLIEVEGAAAASCEACSRLFGLSTPADIPLSFGITRPESLEGELRVRARMFRAERVQDDGSPDPRVTIDVLGSLPAGSGVVAATIPLFMGCLGVEADRDGSMSCDPNTGALAPIGTLDTPVDSLPQSASWAPGKDVPCAGPRPEGMVCLPGGAFFMGGDVFNVPTGSHGTDVEQLVVVSPFALDIDEVTVGAVRQLINDGEVTFAPTVKSSDAADVEHLCTYVGSDNADNDAMPISCISIGLAQQVCDALGKRLPTEAEWEFAAGNRNEETLFAWGDDTTDICARSVIGRGRNPLELPDYPFESFQCHGADDEISGTARGAAWTAM